MPVDNDRTLRNVLEKLELLTGERSDGSRRAVLISELNNAIQDLSDQNAVVKKAVRQLEAEFASSSALIKEEMLVRTDENSALAQLITTLKAQIGSNTAQIQDTKRALATKTMAMAEQITTMSAAVNSNSAGIVEEKRVRVTQDEALAQSIQTLTSTVNTNNNTLTAAIQNEQTARANGDQANAQSIQTLTSTVNGNTASITTLTTTTANINGALSASWSVQGNIDGVTGGLRLTGIKKADGTGATYNLIIDANTTINGNLLVNGTINTGAAATNAFTEGTGTAGTWMAEIDILAKQAGDRFIVIGSYIGGAASQGNILGYGGGSAGNLLFDVNYVYTFANVPIRGFMYYKGIQCNLVWNGVVFVNVCADQYYYMAAATTYMAVVVANASGNHHFRVYTSDSTNLAQGVSIAAIRLSK